METLELGYELVRRRCRLTALAGSLTADDERAGVAVRDVLTTAWRTRAAITSLDELDTHLNSLLRVRLDPRGRQ